MKLTPREPTPEMAVAGSIALRLTSFADLDATIEEVTAVWQAMHDAAPSGWQPIETAPKDGTTVLLAAPGRVTCGEWRAEKWPTASEYHGSTGEYLGQYETGESIPAGWFSWDGGFTDDHEPTHWMLLPAPPSEKGE